jgi:hypothetical protein
MEGVIDASKTTGRPGSGRKFLEGRSDLANREEAACELVLMSNVLSRSSARPRQTKVG